MDIEGEESSGSEMSEEVTNDAEDLYAVLGLTKNATESEIRKAYYGLALKCHPDRNPDDPSAKEKFQKVGRAYEILGDKNKRAIYDETGVIDGEDFFTSKKTAKEWEEHWRMLFKKISVEDIQAFEKSYKNSEQETQDLVNEYNQFKGDMARILETHILANDDELGRFEKIIRAKIKSGDLKSYPAFAKSLKQLKKDSSTRKKNAESEAMEAEEWAKELGMKPNDEDSLKNAIISKNKKGKSKQEKDMEQLISRIQNKYAGSGKAKKAMPDEPSEEEFMAARQRLEERCNQPQQTQSKSSKRKRN